MMIPGLYLLILEYNFQMFVGHCEGENYEISLYISHAKYGQPSHFSQKMFIIHNFRDTNRKNKYVIQVRESSIHI